MPEERGLGTLNAGGPTSKGEILRGQNVWWERAEKIRLEEKREIGHRIEYFPVRYALKKGGSLVQLGSEVQVKIRSELI